MRATMFLLFGLLICQVSCGHHGKYGRHLPREKRDCGTGNCKNGCKASDDCIANQGYCITDDEVEDCVGMLFPNECTSVHCSCCVPVTVLEDECATGENVCPADTTCQDKDLGFDCLCGTGLRKCGDIDECAVTPDLCGAYSICINTFGSYVCSCIEGYQRIGDTCEDIDECADVDTCPPNSGCVNSPGSFDCVCEAGFEEANGLCLDADECIDSESCPQYNECVNTPGSYECICIDGYEIVNETCEDIDECDVNIDPCGNGTCENTPGTYICNCAGGFMDIGGTCEDINECESGACGHILFCTNTPGSYICTCEEGYQEEGGVCADINECESNPCDISEDCYNFPGFYKCVCKGWKCPARCFANSFYTEESGCITRLRTYMTFAVAEERCSDEHKGLVTINSMELAMEIKQNFPRFYTGQAWIGGVNDSIAIADNPSECLAIEIEDSQILFPSIPCDSVLSLAFCREYSPLAVSEAVGSI